MTSCRRATSWLIALLVAGCVLSASACSTAPATVTSDGFALDGLAQIDVSPVDYDGKRLVTAVFGTIEPGRKAVLQRKTDTGWEDVATGEQDVWGEVEFLAEDSEKDVFRALAPAGAGTSTATTVATGEGRAGKQWWTAFSSDFSGSKLPSKQWQVRGTGNYAVVGRRCAAPYPSNVKVEGDQLHLIVSKETDPTRIAKAKAAGCKSELVLRNAIVGTEGLANFRSGLAAARVKLPAAQGMHGSLWLQSNSDSTIRVIDSFGYERGLSSTLLVGGKEYPHSSKTDVLDDVATDRGWWDQYHVYSVEWTNTAVEVRIDGELIRRTDRTLPDASYFLVISLLSPDKEQKQSQNTNGKKKDTEPTRLPQTMSVDWVKVWSRA